MKLEGKIYYGWWIVLASFFLMFAGVGILINCIGVFYSAVLRGLGFSRGAFGFHVTLLALSKMASFPVMGRLLVRYSSQWIIGLCVLVTGAGFAAYSQCTQLWHFYLVAVVVGIFGAGTSILPASTLLTNWFVDRRGLAMGIAFTGSGVGGMICNPLAQWVIDHWGWQSAYVVLGVTFVAVTLPFAVFVIKLHPAMKGLTPPGAGDGPADVPRLFGSSTAGALGSITFWILAVSFLLLQLLHLAIQNNIPIYLHDLGYLTSFAASVMAAFMGLQVLGKLILGFILDRWGPGTGIVFGISLYIVALLAFVSAGNVSAVMLFVVAFALACPLVTVLPSYLTGDIFGNLDYGTLYGIVQVFATIGTAVSMPLTGYVFEKTGSFLPVWYLFIGVALVILLLLFTALRNRDSIRETWGSRGVARIPGGSFNRR